MQFLESVCTRGRVVNEGGRHAKESTFDKRHAGLGHSIGRARQSCSVLTVETREEERYRLIYRTSSANRVTCQALEVVKYQTYKILPLCSSQRLKQQHTRPFTHRPLQT